MECACDRGPCSYSNVSNNKILCIADSSAEFLEARTREMLPRICPGPYAERPCPLPVRFTGHYKLILRAIVTLLSEIVFSWATMHMPQGLRKQDRVPTVPEGDAGRNILDPNRGMIRLTTAVATHTALLRSRYGCEYRNLLTIPLRRSRSTIIIP